jgi:O-antigen/teichoic acid export membrane protein
LVVAKIVGAAGESYIGWAQGLAFLPLEVMNQLNVIIFPLYSRLQDDKSELKETAGKMIFLLALILCPMWLGISALTPSLIDFVGAHKWLPAEQLVYLFIFGAFWASLSTPATILLNAVGQVKISLKLMVMWTILEWVITPLTTWYFGFVGFGISYGIISLTSIIPLVIIKRKFDIAIWSNVRAPLILSIVMSIPVYFIAQNFVHNFLQLLLVAGSGAVIYGALLLAFIKPKVIDLVKSLRR